MNYPRYASIGLPQVLEYKPDGVMVVRFRWVLDPDFLEALLGTTQSFDKESDTFKPRPVRQVDPLTWELRPASTATKYLVAMFGAVEDSDGAIIHEDNLTSYYRGRASARKLTRARGFAPRVDAWPLDEETETEALRQIAIRDQRAEAKRRIRLDRSVEEVYNWVEPGTFTDVVVDSGPKVASR